MATFKYIPPKMGLTPQGRLRPGGLMDIKSSPAFFNDVKRFGRKKSKARRFYGRDKGAYEFMKNCFISEFQADINSPKTYTYVAAQFPVQKLTPRQIELLKLEEERKQRETRQSEQQFDKLKEIRRESRTAIEGLRNMNTLSREIRGWTTIFAGL